MLDIIDDDALKAWLVDELDPLCVSEACTRHQYVPPVAASAPPDLHLSPNL